jgi:hypothetical protein
VLQFAAQKSVAYIVMSCKDILPEMGVTQVFKVIFCSSESYVRLWETLLEPENSVIRGLAARPALLLIKLSANSKFRKDGKSGFLLLVLRHTGEVS